MKDGTYHYQGWTISFDDAAAGPIWRASRGGGIFVTASTRLRLIERLKHRHQNRAMFAANFEGPSPYDTKPAWPVIERPRPMRRGSRLSKRRQPTVRLE